MTIILPSTEQISAPQGTPDAAQIRALIANHLEVDVGRVTDNAHFIDDLGADWLDRLELMIVIEDYVTGLEISDDDTAQIQRVGDLIRYIERWNQVQPTMIR